jgi:26S proteasome regulatory subunit N5
VATAADYLQEVHVETYGSLSKKEKVEYILEQLRLTLAKKDYVRAAIVSGKINRKHLAEMADYKVRFFTLLAILHRHEKNAIELVKDYHAIYLTLQEKEDDVADAADAAVKAAAMDHEAKWHEALQATVVFLALAPYGNEQQDIMNKVNMDPNLEKLPLCQYVLFFVGSSW